MTYLDVGMAPWALFLVAASVVGVSLGGPALQRRFLRAPVAILAAFLAALAICTGLAGWAGPGSVSEQAVVGAVGWGLPAIASLAAVAVLRRAARWVRITVALLAGATGAIYAVLAALVVACGFGNCL